MNILLDINDFNIENVFLMESKNNIVINGTFIRILYSCDFFTMNGIFVLFPILNFERKYFNGKNIMYFDIKSNFDTISLFSNLESDIIDFYIIKNGIKNKKRVTTIGTQLKNGMIKYYNFTNHSFQNKFYLKISGIWETTAEIGITYKIINY